MSFWCFEASHFNLSAIWRHSASRYSCAGPTHCFFFLRYGMPLLCSPNSHSICPRFYFYLSCFILSYCSSYQCFSPHSHFVRFVIIFISIAPIPFSLPFWHLHHSYSCSFSILLHHIIVLFGHARMRISPRLSATLKYLSNLLECVCGGTGWEEGRGGQRA